MPHKSKIDRLNYYKIYYRNNRDRAYINRQRSSLKIKFGITPEQYEQMLISQDFKCALCERHVSEFSRKLCVDHDHETGKIRGLLCTKCNVCLAQLGDNTKYIAKVLK